MKNKKILIVWDWNGTLVDDAFLFVKIMNTFLLEFGLPKISLQDYKNFFCFPVSSYYSHLGLKLSKKEFRSLSASFIKKYKQLMFVPTIKKNIFPVLRLLSINKHSQVVVSAQEQLLLNRSIEHYDVSSYFSGVFGLNNTLAKSKSLLVQKNILPLIKNYSKVLFIGDTLHDFEVACLVEGAECCLVSWGHNSSKRLLSAGVPVVASSSSLLLYVKNFIYR